MSDPAVIVRVYGHCPSVVTSQPSNSHDKIEPSKTVSTPHVQRKAQSESSLDCSVPVCE